LVDLKASAQQAVDDITGAESKYSKAIKLTVREVDSLIQQFATTTLESIQAQSEETQNSLVSQMVGQISNMEKFFSQVDDEQDDAGQSGDSIVTYRQFQALENKVDKLIMLQQDIAAKIFGMNRLAVAAAKKKLVRKKVKPKPATNFLKF
jgi:hypothetical protein